MILRPRTLLLALTASLALATPFVLAAAAPAPAPRAADTKLDEDMQGLQAGFKALDKALEKKDLAKALESISEMEAAIVAAKPETPSKAAEVKDAKAKEEFLRGYRLKLIDLQRALLDVEAALVEGKADEARKLLEQKVKPIKKAGHDAYKADD